MKLSLQFREWVISHCDAPYEKMYHYRNIMLKVTKHSLLISCEPATESLGITYLFLLLVVVLTL